MRRLLIGLLLSLALAFQSPLGNSQGLSTLGAGSAAGSSAPAGSIGVVAP